MDLRQLTCFITVARELHFGRAAAAMHLSQSSVSEHVRRLEHAIGGPLFYRTSRRVRLTPLGETLLPDARRAVDAVDAVYARGRKVVQHGRADIRVGLAADVAHDLLAPAVRILHDGYPELQLSPRQMRTPAQIDALLEHDIDVGLCWEPPDLPHLVRTELGRESFVLLVRTDHRFASMSAVPLDDAAREPLVMFHEERNPWAYRLAVSVFSDASPDGINIAVSGDGIHDQIPHVVAGHGVAVSVTAIAAPVNEPDVVLVRLEDHLGPRRFAIHHIRDHTRSTSAAVEAFVKAAADLCVGTLTQA